MFEALAFYGLIELIVYIALIVIGVALGATVVSYIIPIVNVILVIIFLIVKIIQARAHYEELKDEKSSGIKRFTNIFITIIDFSSSYPLWLLLNKGGEKFYKAFNSNSIFEFIGIFDGVLSHFCYFILVTLLGIVYFFVREQTYKTNIAVNIIMFVYYTITIWLLFLYFLSGNTYVDYIGKIFKPIYNLLSLFFI